MKNAIILQNAINKKNRIVQKNNKQAELPLPQGCVLVSVPTWSCKKSNQ
jgi:hypothetical protein